MDVWFRIISLLCMRFSTTRTITKLGEETCALKLDMAYDRVEWGFLSVVLAKQGFCAQWILLFMTCVVNVEYNVVFNGKRLSPFKLTQDFAKGAHSHRTYSFCSVSRLLFSTPSAGGSSLNGCGITSTFTSTGNAFTSMVSPRGKSRSSSNIMRRGMQMLTSVAYACWLRTLTMMLLSISIDKYRCLM